jgi:hypothetical protein
VEILLEVGLSVRWSALHSSLPLTSQPANHDSDQESEIHFTFCSVAVFFSTAALVAVIGQNVIETFTDGHKPHHDQV